MNRSMPGIRSIFARFKYCTQTHSQTCLKPTRTQAHSLERSRKSADAGQLTLKRRLVRKQKEEQKDESKIEPRNYDPGLLGINTKH